MATIRGIHKGINDKALKEAIDNFCREYISKAAEAGKRLMLEKRSSAVRTWYHSTAATAMNGATHCVQSPVKQSGDKFVVTITSYVDSDQFESIKKERSERDDVRNTYANLVGWRYRHEMGNRGSDGKRQANGGHWTYKDKEPSTKIHEYRLRQVIDMPVSIGEYMFNLPWEDGIIGLPPEARKTDTGWENPNKSPKRDPLEEYVKGRLKKEWTSENINMYMN